jgi:hypothetical protein
MLNIWAYNPNSEGCAELARALGIQRIRHENSRYVGSERKTVINWGSSTLPDAVARSRILNSPGVVAAMSNKRKFFELMEDATDVRVPEWTTSKQETASWIENKAKVCARAKLTGHSGEGLSIHSSYVDIPDVSLYTIYVPKDMEFRVHIVDGEIIDVQRKIKRPDFEGEVNWKIRNHAGGFLYARNGVDEICPEDVRTQALACMERSGLDFGAVDVIWNAKRAQAYVLEINTAPGLQGQTVTSYADAFRKYA